jgi:hypothetical protein
MNTRSDALSEKGRADADAAAEPAALFVSQWRPPKASMILRLVLLLPALLMIVSGLRRLASVRAARGDVGPVLAWW